MKKQDYLLVIAVFVLLVGGVVLDRSMAASATPIGTPADRRTARTDFASARPVDADYAVPGVLDDRSWKPEYGRMPTTHVASYVRHRAAPVRPDAAMPVTIADDIVKPVVTPALPAEQEPNPAGSDAAVAPQLPI
jgi:hypothetical protein